MEYWTLALQALAALAFLFYYFNRRYNFWSDRGVPGPKPLFGMGNMWTLFRQGQTKMELEWAAKYGKFYGIYMGFQPSYTIADADAVKQVLVKDFSYFVNRQKNPLTHEIVDLNLFNAEDELWRRIRAITSPSFTSGKLKGMHVLMNASVEKLGKFFDKVIRTNEGKMNIKEVIMGFTIDIIGTCAFATETNANDENSRSTNPFLINGAKLFEFGILRMAILMLLPAKLTKWLGYHTTPPTEFFVDLGREIVKQRKGEPPAGSKKRQDFVQLMMDAFVYEDELQGNNYDKLTASDANVVTEVKAQKVANGSIKRTLSENEIIAQCFLFFLAGYETTATTLSNALYHLALYPEIQDRLSEELESALGGMKENSEEYFETVTNKIPYLEAVLKETLRIMPPVGRLQRRVNIDGYKLNGVTLEKEGTVDIAVYAMHHNEEYYPEPSRFNPDRFLPENKHSLVPYTYLPFGAGPRNCIGMRFAYQEMRLCLAKIIRAYKFSPTAETDIPMKFNKIGIVGSANIQLQVSAR